MQTAAAGVDQRTVFTSTTNACTSRTPFQLARKYFRRACENKSELQQTVESNTVFWLVPLELKNVIS